MRLIASPLAAVSFHPRPTRVEFVRVDLFAENDFHVIIPRASESQSIVVTFIEALLASELFELSCRVAVLTQDNAACVADSGAVNEACAGMDVITGSLFRVIPGRRSAIEHRCKFVELERQLIVLSFNQQSPELASVLVLNGRPCRRRMSWDERSGRLVGEPITRTKILERRRCRTGRCFGTIIDLYAVIVNEQPSRMTMMINIWSSSYRSVVIKAWTAD